MKNVKKFLVAFVGTLSMVLTTILAVGPQVIPMGLLPWVQIFIASAISAGVYQVNGPKSVPSLYPTGEENPT